MFDWSGDGVPDWVGDWDGDGDIDVEDALIEAWVLTESWREMQRERQEKPATCASARQASGCENAVSITMGLLIVLGILLCVLVSILSY